MIDTVSSLDDIQSDIPLALAEKVRQKSDGQDVFHGRNFPVARFIIHGDPQHAVSVGRFLHAAASVFSAMRPAKWFSRSASFRRSSAVGWQSA